VKKRGGGKKKKKDCRYVKTALIRDSNPRRNNAGRVHKGGTNVTTKRGYGGEGREREKGNPGSPAGEKTHYRVKT